MTTKEYLGQVQRLDRIIQNKTEDLIALQTMAYGISGVSYDKDRVQSTFDPDKIGKTVAKILDMESEKAEIIEKYLDRREEIEAQIGNVPNVNYYNVLYRKFILGKSIDCISNEIHCSISTAKRYYKRALEAFENMYGEAYLNEKFDLYFKVEP